MLWNASTITDKAVAARDGRIGAIIDFLFEDTSWHIRWVVVKTGTWLAGRKVLIPVSALRHPGLHGHEFPIDLTIQQIKDSPDIDTDRPVSRQMEMHVFDHYGWIPYWGDGLAFGAYGFAGGIPASPFPEPSPEEREIIDAQRSRGDPHLRSVAVITEYHVHASDGEIGHVDDVLLDDAGWAIRYLVVDTKNWWSGRKVLISPTLVQGFDWHQRRLNVDADREAVAASSPYDPSVPLDRDHDKRHHHDGRGVSAPPRPARRTGKR
jgi:hypothetical protein